MRAVTLWRPWAGCVAHLRKRVENRGGPFPRGLLGEVVAIHAGRRWDHGALDFIEGIVGREALDAAMPLLQAEGIVATAKLRGWIRFDAQRRIVELHGDAREVDARSPWLGRDEYSWVLGEVRALATPVRCSGAQGFWTVPEAVERRVAEHLRRAA